MRFKSLFSTALLLVSLVGAAQTESYNEVYDSHGRPRAGHQEVRSALRQIDEQKRQAAYTTLGNRNRPIRPDPVILSDKEFEHIKEGLKQRLKALHAFLKDLKGKKSILSTDILPKDIIELTMGHGSKRAVGLDAGSIRFDQHPITDISFLYAGDFIRNNRGEILILEDGVSNLLGGLYYYDKTKEHARDNLPELRALYAGPSAKHFLSRMVKNMKQRSPSKTKPTIVFLQDYPDSSTYFYDTAKQAFRAAGANVIELKNDVNYVFQEENKKISIVEYPKDGKHKQIASTDNLMLMNWNDLAGSWKFTIESAWKKGLINLTTTPGVNFCSNKLLYPYIDHLIEFYLKEKPILQSIASWRAVDHQGEKLQGIIDEVTQNFDQYVLKYAPASAGGKGVYVGPKISEQEKQKAIKLLNAEPENFLIQKYHHPSVIDNQIIDIRPYAFVDQDGEVQVSDFMWSRSSAVDGNGKVNLSDKTHKSFQRIVIPTSRAQALAMPSNCFQRFIAHFF